MSAYANTPITVAEAAEILGLSPKTLYKGGAGTYVLKRMQYGTRSVRMIRQEVEALRDRSIKRAKDRIKEKG